jgi:hypothetical protein
MWSFFRRAPILPPAPPLLSEINALDQETRDRTARQLAWLWSSFTEGFGISGSSRPRRPISKLIWPGLTTSLSEGGSSRTPTSGVLLQCRPPPGLP